MKNLISDLRSWMIGMTYESVTEWQFKADKDGKPKKGETNVINIV